MSKSKAQVKEIMYLSKSIAHVMQMSKSKVMQMSKSNVMQMSKSNVMQMSKSIAHIKKYSTKY